MLYLLERGLEVVAIDVEGEAIEILDKRLPVGARATLVVGDLRDVELPTCDVAIALFSLFFLPPQDFGEFWQRLRGSLRSGAVFAGQFLGTNDDWADRGYTVHTGQEVMDLFSDFDVLYFEEAERDGETALREPKHWHVFHVAARLKQTT